MAARDRPDDPFEASANFGNGALALDLADLLISAAEDENHAARDEVAGIGIGELMTQDGELVVFFRQGRIGLASAFLFDRQVAGVVPEQPFAMLLEE